MFSEQRQEKIMQLLHEYNEVTVSSLTTILSVSEATVRRDLENLEQMKYLHRTHGGAVLVKEETPIVRSFASQTNQITEDLNCIGRTAANFLTRDEIVAIGPGKLGLALAMNIPNDVSCTVITNDVLVMIELLNHQLIKVIIIGGLVRKESENEAFVSGELAMAMLDEIHIDKSFLSVDGVDMEKGLTIKNYEHALIWKKLRGISNEVVIMAKPDAFNKKDFIKLMPIGEIKYIISGKDVSHEYKKYFFENGIPLYTSFDL
jgi:DeoR family fructose operon transcriptional repressor